jgi:hypothetical protein
MQATAATCCIALAALVAGCNKDGPNPATGAASATASIVVLRDDGSLPRRCGVRRTVSRLAAFVDAFNRGDAGQLDQLVSDRDHFQWYSAVEGHGKRARAFTANGLSSAVDTGSGGPGPPTDGRPALLNYLARRKRMGERLRLVEVKVTGIRPRAWFPNIADEVAGVEFSIRLEAPDLASFSGHNTLAGGKAGFGCSDGRLLAWSIGLDTAGGRQADAQRLCGRASGINTRNRSRTRILACTG